jgi:hypothetical protein
MAWADCPADDGLVLVAGALADGVLVGEGRVVEWPIVGLLAGADDVQPAPAAMTATVPTAPAVCQSLSVRTDEKPP